MVPRPEHPGKAPLASQGQRPAILIPSPLASQEKDRDTSCPLLSLLMKLDSVF